MMVCRDAAGASKKINKIQNRTYKIKKRLREKGNVK